MMEGERQPEPIASVWRDRLGSWAIRSLQVLAILALAYVATRGLIEVRLVVIPLIIALIIAAAAAPFVAWLRRHRFPPMLAAWTTLFAALLVLGSLITLIVVTVRSQWDELAGAATAGYEQLKLLVLDLPAPFSDVDWDGVRDLVVEFVTSARFGVGALAGVTTVVSVLTGTILVIVLLFFFLKDGDAMWAFLTKPLERKHRERAERVVHDLRGVGADRFRIELLKEIPPGGIHRVGIVPVALVNIEDVPRIGAVEGSKIC